MTETGQAGQLLAQAREAQKRSLQEVANELKLSVSFVKAIEAEQCSSLPDVAFVRGYVRNYARLLGLSKEETQQVVAHFESIMAPAKDIASGTPVVAPKTQGPRWWRLLWLIAIVAIIGQVLYMWQHSEAPAGSSEAALPKAETVPPQEKRASATESRQEREEDGHSTVVDDEELSLEISEDIAQPDDTDTADIAEVDIASEQAEPVIEETPAALVLAFADECWVSVTDNTGRTLFSGIKQGGEELILEGEAPYRFVFGNGAALESMRIDGEKVTLPERRAGQVWRYASR